MIVENKKDTSVIPKGLYCYSGDYKCPYWSIREDKPHQANGYCAYLGKGDWEINKETKWEIMKDGKGTGKFVSGDDIGGSLLWDSCKECGVKDEFEEGC